MRPPELGRRHGQIEDGAVLIRGHADFPADASDLGAQTNGTGGRAIEIDLDADVTISTVEGHLGTYRGQARAGPAFEADRSPDAGGHQGRTPVPTKIAGHLAHEIG